MYVPVKKRSMLSWVAGERFLWFQRRPKAKVRVERARPMIVRYWKCQP